MTTSTGIVLQLLKKRGKNVPGRGKSRHTGLALRKSTVSLKTLRRSLCLARVMSSGRTRRGQLSRVL